MSTAKEYPLDDDTTIKCRVFEKYNVEVLNPARSAARRFVHCRNRACGRIWSPQEANPWWACPEGCNVPAPGIGARK
jgi:hypothetical protein